MSQGIPRYTVRETADILGISEGAVRNRLSRGTLRSVREHGTVYVLLPDRDAERDTGDMSEESKGEEFSPSALMSEMRGRIEDLRSQLEAEREANRENRRIIAALTSRIPELPQASSKGEREKDFSPSRFSPSEPRESPESAPVVSEGEERAKPQPTAGGPQEDAQRPWWRRVFGG
jgi:hypothetical protein